MLEALNTAQGVTLLLLGVAAFALEVYALIDALRHRPQAYAAAGKLSKTWWVAILGVAAAVGFVTISRVLGLGIIGVVAAGVYLADVRPALRSVSGRRGGGTHSGPYGPW